MEQALAEPDPHLPQLTVAQAGRLRGLAVGYFFRNKIKVRSAGDRFVAGDWVYHLDNLADVCRSADPDAWPELIDRHFTVAGKHQDAPARDVDLARVFGRLFPADQELPGGPDGFRYLRPVAEGLVEALNVDLPDAVRTLNDDDVARAGLETLRTAGRENLVAEPVDHSLLTDPGTTVHVLSGGSFFVASKALVLAETIRAITGAEPPDDGVLLMVPTRSLLLFHPIADTTVFQSIQAMLPVGLTAHDDGPGSLSRVLYWWRQGVLTPVSHTDDRTREITIVVPADLQAIMERLVAS